ncbi:single-stranded-DNA-specific exonuclease RecJ [Candidatus Dependentiae bacterium]|nr:MAG: single-stranded-DNA-specific exonuclease RecJ [Candidatus Dependentiae bacterium]
MKLLQGSKYLWLLPEHDTSQALRFAASYNISFPLIQMLITRGFTTTDALDVYLFGSKQDVPHPSILKDAQKAVDRIVHAIDQQEKILIFGDYDADGITSTAMMMNCLLLLGADMNFFLPNRAHDGYGISVKAVKRAAMSGYKLVITVDNGITAFDAAKEAKNSGIDLIITDHHKPHDILPDAYAIVNPHQSDCPYSYKELAGVGVTFKLLSLLFDKVNVPLPSKVYELLLLGTVADVVPLTGENRFWVRYGLQQVNRQESYPVTVLKRNGRLDKPSISSLDVGFVLAPQINALGRMEDPRQAVAFLISANKCDVDKIGAILYELNEARKELERSIVTEIETAITEKKIDLERENIIFAASSIWPPGVIGLVASRLVFTYGRPALLFHLSDDGLAKGSCRSIPAFNIFEALQSCSHLLEQFGGHSCAAGLSLKQENLPKLKCALEELISSQLTDFDLQPKIKIDAEINLSELTKKFITDMTLLEPFGNGNEQPVFYVKKVSLVQPPVVLKGLHVKCLVFADGIIKPLIFFNRPDLIESLLNRGNEPFDVAVYVTENYWNGRTNIELIGIDIT